jgi:superfamily II DNA helicase RecQ
MDIVLVEEQSAVCQTIEGLNIEARVKEIYGDVYLRTSQYRVCMELLSGRHAQTTTAFKRHDVFFSAPCGFGKSLSFVAAATMLGGITVSV